MRFADRVAAEREFLVLFGRRLGLNTAGAEDLAHDTMLRAIQFERNYRVEQSLRGWLIRMMQNTQINRHRHEKMRVRNHKLIVRTEEAEAPVDWFDGEVIAALERVPVEQRIVILFADLLEHPYADTARILQIPIGTVMSRLYRGRRAFIAVYGGVRVKFGAKSRDRICRRAA